MSSWYQKAWSIVLVALLIALCEARADQPIPANILNPKTPAEAWNVIRLSTDNVKLLIDEQRPAEIAVQISYCSPSLRKLATTVATPEAARLAEQQSQRALSLVNSIARSAQEKNLTTASNWLAELRRSLAELGQHYDAKTVSAEILTCPMHPEVVSETQPATCLRCGITLIPRRIPYSFIYTKPGEPTIRLSASTTSPIESGRKVEVRLRLERKEGGAVTSKDLLETHTHRVHLLIEEPGLGDYHHEHPLPGAAPGEYTFSFTPRKSAPYRIWADLIPLSTGVQELPWVDLPAAGKFTRTTNAETSYVAKVDQYEFRLTLAGGNSAPLVARQTRQVWVTVTDSAGKPVTVLEPFMNAFAHLVGFYGDYQTVVHLHPTGGDILNPDFRGGPSLGFMFYPPRSGFIRLYCQIQIGGKMFFAPFNVNVEELCAPPAPLKPI